MKIRRTGLVLISTLTVVVLASAPAHAAIWLPTANMNLSRSRHTATLLPNGKVLVTGGITGTLTAPAITGTSELYEPGSGTWVFTGSLSIPRSRHTATLLPNGSVLVAGGRAFTGLATDAAELYNPTTGGWTLIGRMHIPRDSHTATLLADGRVLVTGGLSLGDGRDNPIEKTAEIYDYRTGVWSFADHMAIARFGHTSTLLADSTVLIAGGAGPRTDGVYTRSAEIYDPAKNNWRPIAPMSSERGTHIAELLPDGSVLAAGGLTLPADDPNRTNAAERWVPWLSRWLAANAMSIPRAAFGGVHLSDGRCLVSGGRTSTAEIYDVASGTWSPTASMAEARTFHRLVLLPGGTVLAVGGENASGSIITAELFMP